METELKRFRGWTLTWNNYTSDDLATVQNNKNFDYIVGQEETGEKGTKHIQFYVYRKNPVSFKYVKQRFPHCHIEAARGTPADNKRYCSKEETRTGNRFEIGECPQQGTRNDFEEIKELLKEKKDLLSVCEQFPSQYIRYSTGIQKMANLLQKPKMRNMTVRLLIGPTGTGKTWSAIHSCPALEDVYIKDPATKWWDGYENQKVVIIDDFLGTMDYSYLLRLLDTYPIRVETKGSHTSLSCETLWITSNQLPTAWYPTLTLQQLAPLFRRLGKMYYCTQDSFRKCDSYEQLYLEYNKGMY